MVMALSCWISDAGPQNASMDTSLNPTHWNADFAQRVVVPPAGAGSWQPSPEPGVHRHRLDRIGDEVARAFLPGLQGVEDEQAGGMGHRLGHRGAAAVMQGGSWLHD